MDSDERGEPVDPAAVERTVAELRHAAFTDPGHRADTARHEAGHIVCSVALGEYPDGAELADEAGSQLGITLQRSGDVLAWRHDPDRFRRCGVRCAAVLIAGDLATQMADGDDEDAGPMLVARVLDPDGHRRFMRTLASAGDDHDRLWQEVDERLGEQDDVAQLRVLVDVLDHDEAVRLLEDAHGLAAEVLGSCRADVEAVAGQLLEHGRLDRGQLFDLLLDGDAKRYGERLRAAGTMACWKCRGPLTFTPDVDELFAEPAGWLSCAADCVADRAAVSLSAFGLVDIEE